MKKFCITSLKLTALALIALSSFLALAAQYGDNQWDPVKEIQQLRNQHRRDDAIDLVRFLNQNQHYNDDELSIFEKEVAYNPLERAKSFVWDGAIKGQVNDSYSGIGALAADFCLYGDIRDVSMQTWNLLFDQKNFDGVISVLSGAGIALSTMPLFDGMYAMNKNTAKYVHKIPARMNQGMLRSFLSGHTPPEQSTAIYDLLKKTDGLSLEQHLV